MENQKVLDVLNRIEVFEQSGGEEAYALVEITDEVADQLDSVGISVGDVERYGDKETFCIIAFACSEGYADWYDGNKLLKNDTKSSDEIKLSNNGNMEEVYFLQERIIKKDELIKNAISAMDYNFKDAVEYLKRALEK